MADSADDPEITGPQRASAPSNEQSLGDHREILALVYYHEKSVEDCALILGIPAATVKTRTFYARKKLVELVVGAGLIQTLSPGTNSRAPG